MSRVLLCILDGVGEAPAGEGNAVTSARMPVMAELKKRSRWVRLQASGRAVGLPAGQIGNSEVGHVAIGAGRIVLQDLPRIDAGIESGALFARPVMRSVARDLRPPARLHLLGVLSEGGVHGHWRHIAAIAGYFLTRGHRVCLHGFTDGRDALPGNSLVALTRLLDVQPQLEVATLTGRFFAMDRDQNWRRTRAAADVILQGRGSSCTAMPAAEALAAAYRRGQSDEYLPATSCLVGGRPYDGLKTGDMILHCCFRADRARQLTSALLDAQARMICLTPYGESLNKRAAVILPPRTIAATLGEVVSRRGLQQTRIAETEKYAHVTYFFNGGAEEAFAGENRTLIPSHKCRSYASRPQMAAAEVTKAALAALADVKQSLIVVNYANGDMVGHTGNFPAAVQAMETVDACVGQLVAGADKHGVDMLVTADHGNAEQMIDPDSRQPHTAHTLNPVPLIAAGRALGADGSLIDLAPTVLDLLAIKPPELMRGRSLLVPDGAAPE